jgi:hypothetical protein
MEKLSKSTAVMRTRFSGKLVLALRILVCALVSGFVALELMMAGPLKSSMDQIPHLPTYFFFALAAGAAAAGLVVAARRRLFIVFVVTIGGGILYALALSFWIPKLIEGINPADHNDVQQASKMFGLWIGIALSFTAACTSAVVSWLYDKVVNLSDTKQPLLAMGFAAVVIGALLYAPILAVGDLVTVQRLFQPRHDPAYQLEPSRWVGTMGHQGARHPFILVIEEANSDHTFVGYMEWSGPPATTLAIEGKANGNYLEFVDTVFPMGDEDNGTGDRKDVRIKGDRMIGTDKGGTVSFRAQREPWTPSEPNSTGAIAMKASYVKWKQDVDVCRNRIGSPVEDCWRALAQQSRTAVFCNEIAHGTLRRACKNSVPGQVVAQSTRVEVATADVRPSQPAQVLTASNEPAVDFEQVLREVEELQAQFAQVNPERRRALIPHLTEKMGTLHKAERSLQRVHPETRERITRELGERTRAVAEAYRRMYEGMSQEDLMQMLMGTIKQHEQERDRLCEQGNAEACVAVADDRFSKDKWQEAKQLYASACAKGLDKACFGQVRAEAIDGDPSTARSLLKRLCDRERSPVDCFHLEMSPATLVGALPPNTNLVHAPLPDGVREKLKLPQAFLQDADPGKRLFGEGLKNYLGMDGPVDFAQAERAFLQAQLQGMDVPQALIQAASEVRHSGGGGTYPYQTTAWAKVKQALLYKKACGLGEQRACPDFAGDPQWNQAKRQFGMGQFDEAKSLFQELCSKGRSTACLAWGAAEVTVGQPARAREVYDKYCGGTQANRNDKMKEGCRHLGNKIDAVSGTGNLDHAPFPEQFKTCFKSPEYLLQQGDPNSRAIAAGLVEFLGIDRPVNKSEAERLFLTADQQWLKSSMTLTSAARHLSGACPDRAMKFSVNDLINNGWKVSSLLMTACRLGDSAACQEDGFRRFFYDIARDEDFSPARRD